MSAAPSHRGEDPSSAAQSGREGDDVRHITDVVTRLRRALRASVRSDYPGVTRPLAQVELLTSLADHAPIRVGALAEQLRLAPNTASELVQQLVDAGLARRQADNTDRRVAMITLTEQGLTELQKWQRTHQRRIGAALDELAAPDRAAVVAALPGLERLAAELGSQGRAAWHGASSAARRDTTSTGTGTVDREPEETT